MESHHDGTCVVYPRVAGSDGGGADQGINDFAKDYAKLLEVSSARNELANKNTAEASLRETLQFRDFKAAGAKGILNCEVQSIILPLLADHVLREANHYIRLLSK